MGEGGRGGGSARPERRSREWSTCVACRNLNRIKNFGANNFDILKVRTFHTITSPRRQWSTKTQKHSLELIFLARRMKQFAPSVETK